MFSRLSDVFSVLGRKKSHGTTGTLWYNTTHIILYAVFMSKKKPENKSTETPFSPTIRNKKAHFNYQILEKLEAGIALQGTEVKTLRQGQANLEEAFCRIRENELFLIGCNIPVYAHGNLMNHDPLRIRKLLVHKREIKKLQSKVLQKGFTLIPLRIYFLRGRAKVEVAVAQGKTFADKREKIRDRDVKRDVQRQMRKYNK